MDIKVDEHYRYFYTCSKSAHDSQKYPLIINSNGSGARRLISHNFMNYSDGSFVAIYPIPRWSPDGKWLIYHRCEMNSCMLEENTIYKVEISTGKEEKIVDGGAYPDWKNVP